MARPQKPPGTLHRGPLLLCMGRTPALPTPWLQERTGHLNYLFPREGRGVLRHVRGLGRIRWRNAWEGAFESHAWNGQMRIFRLPAGEETWLLDDATVNRLAQLDPNYGKARTLPIHDMALAWNGILELWGLTPYDGEMFAGRMLQALTTWPQG